MKRLLFWLGMGLVTSALAQVPQQPTEEHLAAERERLQAERETIEQAHEVRMRECWQRFAVNACLREVRRSRHAALDPIRVQELALNAQERVLRTRQRDERLRQKAETPTPTEAGERRP